MNEEPSDFVVVVVVAPELPFKVCQVAPVPLGNKIALKGNFPSVFTSSSYSNIVFSFMHIGTSANVNCLIAATPVALERSHQGVRRWPRG